MNYLMITLILLPILTGCIVFFNKKMPFSTIKVVSMVGTLLTTCLAWFLILQKELPTVTLVTFTQNLTLTLSLDGCGKIFAMIAATLWPVTLLYSYEYMKGEKFLHMFYGFFTASMGVTLGIAFADNLVTLYLFFELLTLTTIPLVLHHMTDEAKRATRYYMYFSMGGAAFAFMGVICVTLLGGTGGQFVFGGSMVALRDHYPTLMRIMYVLAFVGFGVKAALLPCSAWLPRASVAPTPVTALLHAVAVVKAGAFAVIRLTYYGYGTGYLSHSWAQWVVIALASATILYGSWQAVRQQHFKRRLAYSTVANMSYILLGVAFMTKDGLLAASSHMVFHSLIKILAFFVAGAVQHHAKCNYMEEIEGCGPKMPVTWACFTVAALALAGVPPFNGFVSKWYLGLAGIEQGTVFAYIGVGALMISALLTVIYMFQVVIKVWFYPTTTACEKAKEAGLRMAIPMVVLAVSLLVSGLYGGQIMSMLSKLLMGV